MAVPSGGMAVGGGRHFDFCLKWLLGNCRLVGDEFLLMHGYAKQQRQYRSERFQIEECMFEKAYFCVELYNEPFYISSMFF